MKTFVSYPVHLVLSKLAFARRSSKSFFLKRGLASLFLIAVLQISDCAKVDEGNAAIVAGT
jgi:hypothetical protein